MEPKDEIKERLDVADVVRGYLELKSAGSGSYKAICPFHAEKSPSFYVSQEKQIWHCFGCDKGGDVLSFVMEIEGMSFPEALKLLGEKAGVEIPEYRSTKEDKSADSAFELQAITTKFFETLLWQHEKGAIARTYLEKRGISEELGKKFRLGCSPDQWEALYKFLKNKGYKDADIEAAGLVKKRKSNSGYIDRFRHRLMIPLASARGQVLGFTGRLLQEKSEKTGPKYLNSPETAIYHKSNVLFGLDLGRTEIRKKDGVIIVEGNLDVVASHKAGVENVIASSGTALTESQLLQLKKLTRRLIFSFDGDNAGYQAARRGMLLAQKMGFSIQVIVIPPELGKDPDDVVQTDPNAWKSLTDEPKHFMEFFFAMGMKSFDVTNVDSKREFADLIIEEIVRIVNVVEQEHWLQKLADILRIDISVVRTLLQRRSGRVTHGKKQTKGTPTTPGKPKKPKMTTKVDQAIGFLLGVALHDEQYIPLLIDSLDESDISDEILREVYKKIGLLYTANQQAENAQKSLFSQLRDELQKEEKQSIVSFLDAAVLRSGQIISSLDETKVREQMHRHKQILDEASTEARRKQLEIAIRQAEQSGDSERVKALMEEYSKLL